MTIFLHVLIVHYVKLFLRKRFRGGILCFYTHQHGSLMSELNVSNVLWSKKNWRKHSWTVNTPVSQPGSEWLVWLSLQIPTSKGEWRPMADPCAGSCGCMGGGQHKGGVIQTTVTVTENIFHILHIFLNIYLVFKPDAYGMGRHWGHANIYTILYYIYTISSEKWSFA